MIAGQLLVAAGTAQDGLSRAIVLQAHDGGTVTVRKNLESRFLQCDVLQATGGQLRLSPGDEVLVWHVTASEDERGVVIGRIGNERIPEPAELRDEVVVEARKNLTLKCGDGSITIREDGKILIKGRDLVSHAVRVNRIKGGAVAIN
jgi:hypothetical protein